MRSEFSKLRDHWAEFYLSKTGISGAPSLEDLAKWAYEFADAMMKEAGYDPDSVQQPKGN